MKQLFVLILLAALTSAAFGATTPGKTATQSHKAQSLVPIRSPAALQRYLRETPPGKSPLDLLPRGARKRVLGTLIFTPSGHVNIPLPDVDAYLTNAQIRQLLKLFGEQDVASIYHGRARSISNAERTAPESPFERKFDRFYFAFMKAQMPLSKEAGARAKDVLDAQYNKLFHDDQHQVAIHNFDDHDLALLYRAADDTEYDTGAVRYLRDMRLDLNELHRRGLATSWRVADYYQALVVAREFKAANALVAKYPNAKLKTLPPVEQRGNIPVNTPSLMRLSADGHHLWHESVKMNVPWRIVVVANCHFSQDAARAIDTDPILKRLFHRHAVWLAPDNISLTDTRSWNKNFPDQPIGIAWKDSEWPMLDSWAMPTFYVFKHGKLVKEWSGWPHGATTQNLQIARNKLRAAGMLHKQGGKS